MGNPAACAPTLQNSVAESKFVAGQSLDQGLFIAHVLNINDPGIYGKRNSRPTMPPLGTVVLSESVST